MNIYQSGFIYAMIHVMQDHLMLIIGTWRTTEKNSTTTRHMALSIRKLGVRYALPDKGWGLPVVGV
jgi:hypothetical protein